jgi:aspartate kinase
MKVFKFGGASVNNVEKIKNLTSIVKEHANTPLVIVISAMGKTTNALEKVAEAFYAKKKEEALQLFDAVKKQHITTAKYLLVTHFNSCLSQLTDFFTEVEWLLHDQPVRHYDYYYDQIVCSGELISTSIISHYLNEMKINNEWLDVRDLLRTDNTFRDANVDWDETSNKIKKSIDLSTNIYLTQGFIGATDDNESTTLGREGSDYTAAVFANILNAESVTIWKDVEGIMNADPKQFTDATLISELSYDEVIEMAYYGAQVIHPKTIKPLQNKKIPLNVQCFSDISLPGTLIYKKNAKHLADIIVIKKEQVLFHLTSHDFSFVGEQSMAQLYKLFAQLKIKPNLIQTGAINVQVCFDDTAEKIEQLAIAASNIFDVQVEKGLQLLTIRHYTDSMLYELMIGKEMVLLQQTKETVQILFR